MDEWEYGDGGMYEIWRAWRTNTFLLVVRYKPEVLYFASPMGSGPDRDQDIGPFDTLEEAKLAAILAG